MEESSEEILKSKEKMQKFQAYKEALSIINDVSIGTETTSVLPPIKNDIKSSGIENQK